MAAVAVLTSLYPSICRSNSHGVSIPSSSSTSSLSLLHLRRRINNVSANHSLYLTKKKKKFPDFFFRIRALAEETLIPEEGNQEKEKEKEEASTADQPVSVPVSPSDLLTMFFQADGTMSESAVPSVTKALEGIEGVSDLKVQVLEGIASVELTKQTTVQATGVASNLVEVIQGSGFRLQTLNLSFEDEEDTTD